MRLKDTRTPVAVSLTAVAVNIALNLWLVRVMGYRGLALGTAVAAVVNGALLLLLLRRRLGGLDGTRVGIAFGKITIASLAMAVAAWAVAHQVEALLPGTSIPHLLVRVGVAIAFGVVALALSARLLRIAEFESATELLWRRLAPDKARDR